MIKSVLLRAKEAVIALLIMLPIAFSYGFGPAMGEQEWLTWSNKCLSESFDPSSDVKLKKWEIELTPDHFLRLRKTYQHGKQEYFSFNLQKLDNVDYAPGNTAIDTLELKTQADDIIVQTYEDPKGNIDSMTTALNIPVKKLPAQRLDSLRQALNYLKSKGL